MPSLLKAMGRGRKGVLIQSTKKKTKKRGGILPKKDNQVFIVGERYTGIQKVVVMEEDVLNELRQINPQELANILVGMQI